MSYIVQQNFYIGGFKKMGKKIPMWQASLVLLITVLNLCYCLNVMGKLFGEAWVCHYGDAHIALLASALFAGIIAIINGYKWSFLEKGIMSAIGRSMQAVLILLLVGCLIGSWILSGIVPAMVYYGLMILRPSIFLIAACLICGIVSLATGSSWTSAGTVGIALVGIGTSLSIPTAISAGAVVSGALFGDKMSPLSDTTNIAPACAGSELFEHIRHMVYTVTPSLVIALIVYGIIGSRYSGAVDMSNVHALQNEIASLFNMNIFLLLPPVLVIVMVSFKLPAIPGMMMGIILGVFCAIFFQGSSIGVIPGVLHYGFSFTNPDAITPNVVSLFTRGGMDSMLWTVNLIICAMVFGGIIECTGILERIAQSLLKYVKSRGLLVTLTIFSSFFVNLVTGNQYLALILPGRMYKEAFEDSRLKAKNLSRCLEDSGTVTSNLVPWSPCGAYMHSVFGIGQWGAGGYGPYAILCWLCPLVSIFYGFTGITMEKMTEEEYQEILIKREEELAKNQEILTA